MSKLLHISEASSIAIHSLVIIANTNKLINATQIADLTGFSKNHTAKVLNILVKRNYLKSIRGPKGGFELKTPPKDITLLEVFELVDGTFDIDHCYLHTNECPFNDCVFGGITTRLTNELMTYFKTTTIKNFIKNKI